MVIKKWQMELLEMMDYRTIVMVQVRNCSWTIPILFQHLANYAMSNEICGNYG
jgi:hypothetical protein